MNPELFERLLHEGEGVALDFKRGQYKFAKATDDEKSELLKDLLGFANAWRRADAFILVGVEEIRGDRAQVVGIDAAEHLDDHSLQQFVNSLTQRPLRFRYEAFGFEGRQVGIICVDQQSRPIYLTRDFGKLKKTAVYIRRGSSTDPQKPATPDEIAQMQASSPQPTLDVAFADVVEGSPLGSEFHAESEMCSVPPASSIPDLEDPRARSDYGSLSMDPWNRINPNYYRELALFEEAQRALIPLRLVASNLGSAAAQAVRLELEVTPTDGVALVDDYDRPLAPRRRGSHLTGALARIHPAQRSPGRTEVSSKGRRRMIVVEYDDLQPGRQVASETFYIAKAYSGELALSGKLFAANLPEPVQVRLSLRIDVTTTKLTVADLRRLPEPEDDED